MKYQRGKDILVCVCALSSFSLFAHESLHLYGFTPHSLQSFLLELKSV